MRPRLKIIRGIPGSGKTTYAKSLGILHIEQDMYLVQGGEYRWFKEAVGDAVIFCKSVADVAFNSHVDFVVSNTFTRVWEMKWYLDKAKFHGYEVEVIKCTGNYGSVHNVPDSAMEAMRARWEDFPGERAL